MKIKTADLIVDYDENKGRVDPITPESCQSLAISIAQLGQLQPIAVVAEGDKWRVKIGYRRTFSIKEVLGWEEIEAFEITSDADDDKRSVAENIERLDLSFYEQAVCLNAAYEGKEIAEVSRITGKSRTWVRSRMLLWTLPEAIIMKVQSGSLGPYDIKMLLAQSEADREAAMQKLLEARASGKTKTEVHEAISKRKPRMNKKRIQKTITTLVGLGHTVPAEALRYACGEITEKELLARIDNSAALSGEEVSD